MLRTTGKPYLPACWPAPRCSGCRSLSECLGSRAACRPTLSVTSTSERLSRALPTWPGRPPPADLQPQGMVVMLVVVVIVVVVVVVVMMKMWTVMVIRATIIMILMSGMMTRIRVDDGNAADDNNSTTTTNDNRIHDK